jgi:hypothetical protein
VGSTEWKGKTNGQEIQSLTVAPSFKTEGFGQSPDAQVNPLQMLYMIVEGFGLSIALSWHPVCTNCIVFKKRKLGSTRIVLAVLDVVKRF